MGLFGFGKRGKDVVDLAERYRKQKEKEEQAKARQESHAASASDSGSNPFSFFDSPQSALTSGSETGSGTGQDSEVIDLSGNQEKRRKLAKRLADMTEKLEDLSNKIYHLEQRLEVLEKKADVRRLG